jgi:hypothetical protein
LAPVGKGTIAHHLDPGVAARVVAEQDVRGTVEVEIIHLCTQTDVGAGCALEVVETITATLPQIGPRRLADNVLSLNHPEPGVARRSPIIDQWEAMPATTRVKVEGMAHANPSRSLVRWLVDVALLLEQERPAGKRGAPRSITQAFVSRIATIWRTLGLNPGLAYNLFLHPANDDRAGRGGRIESSFQRYCRAALTAVGDPTEISARQVINYKRNRVRVS